MTQGTFLLIESFSIVQNKHFPYRADRWVRVDQVDPAGPRAYHGTISIGVEIFVIGNLLKIKMI
jgi:hypothetical protein